MKKILAAASCKPSPFQELDELLERKDELADGESRNVFFYVFLHYQNDIECGFGKNPVFSHSEYE